MVAYAMISLIECALCNNVGMVLGCIRMFSLYL